MRHCVQGIHRNWLFVAEDVGLPSVVLLLLVGVVEELLFLLSLRLFVGRNMLCCC